MDRSSKTRVFAAALLASVALATSARAQSPTAPPEGDDWEFTVAPYLMGAAIGGTVSVNGREAEADISASDIFDHLDLGLMGMAAARKGNWGLMSDAVFVKLEVESQAPPADFNPSIGIFQLQGIRKVAPWADVTAGVRWNHLNAVIDMKPPFPPVHLDKSHDWVDPVVGVVLRTRGQGRLHGTLIADIGGFGLASKFTWQVFPTVGVRLSKHASLEAGYRFLDVDYETGEGATRFAYDVLYQGPVVGFAFRF